MTNTKLLRNYVEKRETVIAPGAFDGLSARLIERAGFKAIYASGGAIARSSGYPDIGLLSVTEVCEVLSKMADVTNIPIIADADTGFGNTVNVARTIRMFERTGVAALHLEDQQFPKRCGHLNDKNLVTTQEMIQKIKVAKDTLLDPNFILIARTDSIAVEGFTSAIDRANAYLEAGADMIFVEAPESLEQITAIAKQITQPKLINMFYGGKTPLVPIKELEKLGYSFVIVPSDLQRAAIHAIKKTLKCMLIDGDSSAMSAELTSFNEREEIIGTAEYLKLDKFDLK